MHESYLSKVLTTVPLQRRRREGSLHIDVGESTILLLIAAQNDAVLPIGLDTDSVVGITIGRVEVEHKQQACAFEHENFIFFVLQRDIRLFISM